MRAQRKASTGKNPTETKYARRQYVPPTPQETMLADFLRADTPQAKREVIKTFAPHYFIFGDTLDPRNPYEEKENDD